MRIFNNPRVAFFDEAEVINVVLSGEFQNRLNDFDIKLAMPSVEELLSAFCKAANEVEQSLKRLVNADIPINDAYESNALNIAEEIAEKGVLYLTLAKMGLGFTESTKDGANCYLYSIKALLNYAENIGLDEPTENRSHNANASELHTFCESLIPHLPERTIAYIQYRRQQSPKL